MNRRHFFDVLAAGPLPSMDAFREQMHARFGHEHGHGRGRSWADFGGHRGERGGGPGGRGGRGFPPFGFGGGGPAGFRAGRKLSSSDLQLLILALLDEKPRHGYELIKALEERTNGFYVPSPGVIYPALTYLEEAGDAASVAEGARKSYQLTDAGRTHLQKQRAEADALLSQLEEMGRHMARVREAFARDGDEGQDEPDFGRGSRDGLWGSADLHQALHNLRAAIGEQRGASREHWLRIAETLRRAADEIRAAASGEPSAGKGTSRKDD